MQLTNVGTDTIVALKQLKLKREKEGYPITSLREVKTLLLCKHENIVEMREVVVGSTMDKYVFVNGEVAAAL